MIAIIDYGLGNVNAFANIYKSLKIKYIIVKKTEDLKGVSKIILPGVGAFDWAMSKFSQSGLMDEVCHLVVDEEIPVLGVCVGMQIMAKSSEEGERDGLGWIDAEVKRFDETKFSQKTHLPHMGWNNVTAEDDASLFRGMDNPYFYFLHSYYFQPYDDKVSLSKSTYNIEFTSSVKYKDIYGTQFHPEKSHAFGVKLLKNFAEI